MKGLLRILAAAATIAMTTACSNDSDLAVTDAQSASEPASRGVVVNCAARKSAPKSRAAIIDGIVDPVRPAQLDSATMAGLKDVFMTEFPPGEKNLLKDHSDLKNFSTNFSLVSDGRPVALYPVMVGGDAKNTLSVFWYDSDGVYHTQEIWALTEPGVIGSNANGWSCLQDGTGITLNIPAGCVYGLSITNVHPKGTRVKGLPFSTDATQNAGGDLHAGTFSKDGKTYIGFEDLNLPQSDRDYNDLIVMLTPLQTVSSLIEIDIEDKFVCESDDFNINLGNDGYVAIPAQSGEPFDFNGIVDIKNYVPTLNSSDELVFKIRLYKEDKDSWPNDVWKDTPEECLTELIPLNKITGVPSDYKVTYLAKTKAYESTSGEGRVPYIQIDAILKKRPDTDIELNPND
ncbi:MAG: DUF4114 domain-containing protein [Bacteroidaceae bacterium]|nr:DUF4114 domain-containing protein [Bacteroidaceae bacterium]